MVSKKKIYNNILDTDIWVNIILTEISVSKYTLNGDLFQSEKLLSVGLF